MTQAPPTPVPGQPQPPAKNNTAKIVIIVLVVVFGVSLLICGGLAAVLAPALHQARNRAKSAVDMSQLRQVGLAMIMYAADSEGMLPRHVAQVEEYVGTTDVFISPFNPGGSVGGWIDDGGSKALYRYGDYFFAHAYDQDAETENPRHIELNKTSNPSMFILAFSAKVSDDQLARSVLFVDGHVEAFETDADFADRVADQNADRARDGHPEIDLSQVARMEAP